MSRCGRPRDPGSGGAAAGACTSGTAPAPQCAACSRLRGTPRPLPVRQSVSPARPRGAGRRRSRRPAAPAAPGRCSRRSCSPPSRPAGRRRGRRPRASPSWSTASCAVVAAGRPERLALETASGPVRRSRSRATSSSRQPDGDRALGVAEVPGQGRRVLEHQGEPAGPERLGQLVRPPAAGHHQPGERGRLADQHRHGHRPAAVLRGQQPGHRGRRERVGGDAVDGVGRQQHQLAPADRGRGGVEAGGALRRGRCSRRGRPRGRSLPHGRVSARRAVVKRGRPARSGWSSTSANPPCARTSAGSALALLVGVLDAEPAAGTQQPGGGDEQPADDVQPVRAAPQRQRRVVVGDLARHAGAVGHVRRVGDDDVDGAVELARAAPGRSCRRRSTSTGVSPAADAGGGVVPGPLDRAGVALDGGDAGAAGARARSTARSRRSRCPGRRRRAVRPGQPLQRPAGELLGLRPRHEDPGADRQLEVPERRPAGEVLQRHAVGPLVDSVPNRTATSSGTSTSVSSRPRETPST